MNKKNTKKIHNRNHLYFEFKDTTFDVDKENGTVKCTIDGFFISEWPFFDAVRRIFKRNGFKYEDYRDYYYSEGYAKFTGTVKCNDTDKFDEIIGKRIAESKVKSKIYLKSMEMVGQISEETENEIQSLKNLGAKYLGYFAKERMHIFKTDFKHNGSTKE